MAPKIKTEQEMFPQVESWLKSGLTQKQFCLDHQLPVHILVYWVGRYRKAKLHLTTADKAVATRSKATKKAVATDSTSGFIRLASPPQISAPANAPLPTGSMEVVLPSGAVIRFSSTIPVSYLKDLLSQCSH